MNLIHLFIGILALFLIRYGSEGIQGGSYKDGLSYFTGSMSIPALKDKRHRCTTILVTQDIAVTAGHCLLYGPPQAQMVLNFSLVVVYVVMGSLLNTSPTANDTMQRQLVGDGFLHGNYSRIGFGGIVADNNLGALVLFESFNLVKDKVFPVYRDTFSDAEISAALADNRMCRIYSWGSTLVRPELARSEVFCSSPCCDTEREARCLLPQNTKLKMLETTIISHKTCVERWAWKGDAAATYWHAEKLKKVLNDMDIGCFETKNRPPKSDSPTIGDEGAPLICLDKNKREILVGIYVGGLYKSLTERQHFDVRSPNYWINFTKVREFNQSVNTQMKGPK